MYTKILIDGIGTIKHGTQAREWLTSLDARGGLSSITKHERLPNALFHHSEDGKNLPGRAPFAFFARDGNPGIVAIGPQASRELLALIPKINTLAGNSSIRIQCGDCAATITDEINNYEICRLVLQRPYKPGHNGFRKPNRDPEALNTPEFLKHAEKLIRDGIDAQLDLLGDPGPEDPVEIIDLKLYPTAPVFVRKTYAQYCARVTFKSNLRLTGPWYLGRLSSKGAGYVILRNSPRHAFAA
jgi:hypothetical protein